MLILLPAFIALCLKLFVLAYALREKTSDVSLLQLVSFLALHNLAEIGAIGTYLAGSDAGLMMKIYYASTILLVCSIASYAATISKLFTSSVLQYWITSIGSVIAVVIVLSDLMIAGATGIGYTVTAIKGHYYGVFSVSVLACFAMTIYALVAGYISTNNKDIQLKCAYMGFALMPGIIAASAVMGLMALGFKLNASAVIPVASALFLVIIIASERKHKLIDIRWWLPGSSQRRVAIELLRIARRYGFGSQTLGETMEQAEAVFLKFKLEQYRFKPGSKDQRYESHLYNISAAAKDMGMSRGTLYSKLKRYGIAVKAERETSTHT